MKHKHKLQSLGDLGLWPVLDTNALSERQKMIYQRREAALRRFAQDEPLAEIEKAIGINRGQLYRLIKRCLRRHPDGRIQGWRGLLPFLRTRPYQRRQSVDASTPKRVSGASGAMTQLLERHESLIDFIKHHLGLRTVRLNERGELRGLKHLHNLFVTQCRELGLTASHYPLNQERQGLRSLSVAVRNIATQTFTQAARTAGATHIHPPRPPDNQRSASIALRPFEIVEFDGHKLDIRLRLRIVDPLGMPEDIELERAWLLVALDVCSRVILGWNLVLATEYNRHDVIHTFQIALRPWRRQQAFSIPGLAYHKDASFISERMPSTAYGCWDWLRFDNARANLAEDTLTVLCEAVGCRVDAGPVGHPNERPFVERFFGMIATHLSHRLPGSTGMNPTDVERLLSDPGKNISLLVSPEELNELLEVSIANYNGRPHQGLGGRSPVEVAQRFLEQDDMPVRTLSESYRRHLYLISPAFECRVCGSLRRGVRPYINFYGARYSSGVLSEGVSLIGQHLRVYMDPNDMRVVHAFHPKGAELGPLRAARPWDQLPHSLRLRQEIERLKRRREISYTNADDAVAVYWEHKRKTHKKKKKATHHMAEAANNCAVQPQPASDPPTNGPPPTSEGASARRAAPRTLLIGNGQILLKE